MDKQLLEAAIAGDAQKMRLKAEENPALLLGTTAQGNTCLHISSMHGHEPFCTEVMDLAVNHSLPLLSATNNDGETPLVTAVINGHDSLASVLLLKYYYRDGQLNQAVLQQDTHGCNVLHHAIRSGYRDLALELIEAAPALSHARNRFNESPMFIAVLRGYADVVDKLLDIPESADCGVHGHNALHAAVKYGNEDIARMIMERRDRLAREEDWKHDTPLHLTAHFNRVRILGVMLEHDCSLGYTISADGVPNSTRNGEPLLVTAATRGHADFAEELLRHCPDAPYCDATGKTCLHEAINNNRVNFVKFVVREPRLSKLINMQNAHGDSALHLAVKTCNPKMVTALLDHPNIDATTINNDGCAAVWKLNEFDNYAKTINWNKISKLILDDDPRSKIDIYNLHEEIRNRVIDASRKDIKSLTETYTSNTSLVAILIATITFAAAFTLPGGYSNDAGSEGLPIMARKLAFQAFIIADTLGMCSSLAVAFICVIVRWMDFEFLLHYRRITIKLMWFAYMATTVAFATGLYTVMAPRVLWLAAVVCILSVLLPIVTMLFGEWPTLKLRFQIRKSFDSSFLDMV